MEANNLFVLHRAQEGEESPERMRDAVAALGTVVELMPCVWMVKSEQRGTQAFVELRQCLGHGDQLVVVDASNDDFECWPERPDFPDITG
ncbi:MAG: hypothetical protein ACFCUQ_16705 [Kiloniellales bacterium]